MLSIHPELQQFGDEDKTNHEFDEVNKENMNEFWGINIEFFTLVSTRVKGLHVRRD